MLRAADLAAYAPQWTEPLHTTYRGYDVYSNPATSRGGFEVLMGANLIEAVDLKAAGADSPAALHAVIEAIKISKADIYKYVADPAFVKVPTAGLLSKEFATARRALFDPTRAIAYPPAGAPRAARRPRRARRARRSTIATTASCTPRRSRSSIASATPSASRRRSAASSATTSSSARPACC